MKWRILWLWIALAMIGAGLKVPFANAEPISGIQRLKLRLSWGHSSNKVQAFHVSFGTNEVALSDLVPIGFEADDVLRADGCDTHAGAGDVDGVEFTLSFPERKIEEGKIQQIWAYLLEHSGSDTARRLRLDPGLRHDTRKLTINLGATGERGFSVTMDQLLINKTFWVPDLDMFLAAGDPPVSYEQHQQELKRRTAKRVIDELEQEPEATYEQYTSRWEDMGSPAYTNAAAKAPGHIICLSWDSAIPKFGIDRAADVWSDYGNPDHFQFAFDFGGLSPESARAWKVQKLSEGLPVISTSFERDGIRYEVEQFAHPLNRPPLDRRGDITLVLLQKVRLTELEGRSRSVSVGMIQRREQGSGATVVVRTNGTALLWSEAKSQTVVLGI